MKVFEGINEITYSSGFPSKLSITVGNFDGCHIGHQRLIAKVIETSRIHENGSLAVTFDPSPRDFFGSNDNVGHLFTKAQKVSAFRELGLDGVFFQRFDDAFIRLSYEDFYRKFLRTNLCAHCIVIGDNFKFGYKRQGDLDYLGKNTLKDDIGLFIENRIEFGGYPVSSSRIRKTIIESGNMDEANSMLGRPYFIEGRIARGDGIGRRIGFATANLCGVEQIVPYRGVYAGYVYLAGSADAEGKVMRLPKVALPSVFNIGKKPTIRESSNITIEAHMLQGSFGPDALYDRKAYFYFYRRLRDERRFGSIHELQSQIEKDIQQAIALL